MAKAKTSAKKPVGKKPAAKKPAAKKPAAKKPAGRKANGDELLWAIIDRVRKKSRGELGPSCDALRAELEALRDPDLQAVEAAFSAAMQRAYDNRLWHAAYIIHGGCGDDTFWDFRAGLVAMGRKVYEAALKNPDSLAKIEDLENRTLFEGFQYLPSQILEARGLAKKGGGHSVGDPTGEPFDDDEAAHEQAFPRLFARFW